MSKKFPGGVITGDGVQAIFNDAQEHEYALPAVNVVGSNTCLLYTSPSPRDLSTSRMPSSA